MKRTGEKSRSGGFTLVELIVVLVILGILAAIMVPALLGWIDKAKEKKYLLEARNVVMATQVVATKEYAEGRFTGEGKNFINKHRVEILKIADIPNNGKNDIRVLDFRKKDDGTTDFVAVIKKLVYRAIDGTIITYDIGENPIYQVGKETGAPGYRGNWLEIIENIPLHLRNTGEMRKKIEEAYSGFPDLVASETSLFSASDSIKMVNGLDVNTLTWKPVSLKHAEDGFAMIANAGDRNMTGAYLLYYNGDYYTCLNKHPTQGYVFDSGTVQENMQVDVLDGAKDILYYKEHLDEVTGKVWVKM